MEQTQSSTEPPETGSSIAMSAVILVVAAILALLPSPSVPRGEVPAVDPHFFDGEPVRIKHSVELMTDKNEKCTECHEAGDEIQDIEVGKSEEGNHGKKLQHGRNNKCFHCHNPKDMSTFQNRDGDPVAYKDVVETCTSCHGPQYRDWKAGIHGRRTGFFDLKKGERKELTCIQCHDPHFPIFKRIKPAPGPHVIHGHGHPLEEHPKEERPVVVTESPAASQTPMETTPSPSSATPPAPEKEKNP